jgi:hypothetical protein
MSKYKVSNVRIESNFNDLVKFTVESKHGIAELIEFADVEKVGIDDNKDSGNIYQFVIARPEEGDDKNILDHMLDEFSKVLDDEDDYEDELSEICDLVDEELEKIPADKGDYDAHLWTINYCIEEDEDDDNNKIDDFEILNSQIAHQILSLKRFLIKLKDKECKFNLFDKSEKKFLLDTESGRYKNISEELYNELLNEVSDSYFDKKFIIDVDIIEMNLTYDQFYNKFLK